MLGHEITVHYCATMIFFTFSFFNFLDYTIQVDFDFQQLLQDIIYEKQSHFPWMIEHASRYEKLYILYFNILPALFKKNLTN